MESRAIQYLLIDGKYFTTINFTITMYAAYEKQID